MNRLVRACGLGVVAAVALGTAGCAESENEGKLEGTKWSSAYVPDFKGISGRGTTASIHFTDGGRFAMEFRVPHGSVRVSGSWQAGPGNAVFLDNVTPALGGQSSFTEYITVAGDVMTMEDPDGTKIVFTRIDPEMEKANAGGKATGGPKTKQPSGGTVETTTKNGKGVTRTYGP